MRNLVVAIVIALLPAASAAAEPYRIPKDKVVSPNSLVPAKRGVNNCAAYGAGFVKVDGTDTCVKIGGAVRVEGSVGSH